LQKNAPRICELLDRWADPGREVPLRGFVDVVVIGDGDGDDLRPSPSRIENAGQAATGRRLGRRSHTDGA